MEEIRMLERVKSDFKDLEGYLVKNNLLDDKRIWFGGIDNYNKATNNAIAGNLFYGNKRMVIVTIKDNDIYYLKNTRGGFKVRNIGSLDEKIKVTSLKILLNPTVDINGRDGDFFSVKVTKNRDMVKVFKKTIKNK